ncbi:MAG: GGDEF domain-containing protein [Planctomycetota bacterium]
MNMTGTGTHEILLIGNVSSAISDVQSPDKLPIQVCTGIPEGMEAAVKKSFAAILVVMADASAGLRDGLATLRKNTSAKILLLARMYEEPRAREMVGNGTGLADDYLICPIRIQKLCEAIHRSPGTAGDTATTAADTTIQKKIHQLEKLATEDDLTGLKNRRYIREFARQIIERSKKDNGRVTVLIFDIDNFKHYNDVYGHAAGDEVLKQAALLIRRCCRRHDVVARLGGDEFAVVFWDDPRCSPPPEGSERRSFTADHPGEVILIARRFQKELEKTNLRLPGANGTGVLTISGGLAGLDKNSSTIDNLFAKADHALLDAKRNGKNRIYLVGHPENDIDKIE